MSKTKPKQPLLIMGANGRLGSFMRSALIRLPDAPVAVWFSARRAGVGDLILSDTGPLPHLPACGTVIALWGQTGADPLKARQNVALAHRSRAVAEACGAARVFHLSSAAVYGPGAQMNETRIPSATSVYGRSKQAMEQTVARFSDDPARHVCLRLANVVGADSLAAPLSADTPITLDRFADGHGPLRSYLAPSDLLRVLMHLAMLPPADLPATLNIAAPGPVYMEELAKAAGKQVTWRPAPPSAIQTVTLDTRRLQRLLPELRLHKSATDMIADWTALKDA